MDWDDILKYIDNDNQEWSIDKIYNKIKNFSEYYIFGAGSAGEITRSLLKSNLNNKLVGFIDNDIKKHGKTLFEKEIFSLKEIDKKSCIVIASTWGKEIEKQLSIEGYENYIHFPVDLIEWDQGKTRRVLEDGKSIIKLKKLYDLLEDTDSKKILVNSLLYRISNGEVTIPKSLFSQYIHPAINKGKIKSIVDAGAYTGDCFKLFAESFDKLNRIYAFEPTYDNYLKLVDYHKLENFNFDLTPKNVGLWSSNKRLNFAVSEVNGGNNKISDDLSNSDFVDVIALDEYICRNSIDLIKMDIEGSEIEALRGSEKVIKGNIPVLAICIYHNIEHYWQVIELLEDWGILDRYKFYLGHHSVWMLETVLYAVPR